MIDQRLVPDAQEVMTPGEARAGMILNGLGFANRPLSLTPQFFANKPLDLVCREGIDAEMFNRFKLGRTLDEAHAYGGNLFFEALALAVCTHEGGSHVARDSWVSVRSPEGLHSAKSSGTLQRTDRHGILDQKLSDFQESL